jgi:hypothetical protein
VARLTLKQGARRVGYLSFPLGKREQVTTLSITLLGRSEAGEWRLRATGREAR